MSLKIFGLDGEMSGNDLSTGSRLIQIGVTSNTSPDGNLNPGWETFSATLNPGPMDWQPIAEGVHGFTEKEIAAAEPAASVDDRLEKWLLAQGIDKKHRGDVVPVGFNVGQFDMPFLRHSLPKSAALFSRRSIDINALCFSLDGAKYLNNGTHLSWEGWKRFAKQYAAGKIEELKKVATSSQVLDMQEHDAGYDALVHLHAWRFLKAKMHGEPFTMPAYIPPAPVSETQSLAVLKKFGGPEKAALATGVPEHFLRMWATGGRATRENYLALLNSAYVAL